MQTASHPLQATYHPATWHTSSEEKSGKGQEVPFPLRLPDKFLETWCLRIRSALELLGLQFAKPQRASGCVRSRTPQPMVTMWMALAPHAHSFSQNMHKDGSGEFGAQQICSNPCRAPSPISAYHSFPGQISRGSPRFLRVMSKNRVGWSGNRKKSSPVELW